MGSGGMPPSSFRGLTEFILVHSQQFLDNEKHQYHEMISKKKIMCA